MQILEVHKIWRLCMRMRLDWEAMFSSALRRTFHVLTITLLSILLPLSFLLLARLSYANLSSSLKIRQSSSSQPSTPQLPIFLSFFFSPENPTPIHVLVSVLSLSAFLHGLTGWTPFLALATGGLQSCRLCLAWALLFTLQVLVALGVEGSIASGIGSSLDFGNGRRSLGSRAFYFLGLHGTVAHWCQAVVKPVVDDTVYGAGGTAGIPQWPEKAAVVAVYGGLWWWRLRDEVEAMVIVPHVKKELMIGVGMVDFVGWWLYYLTVAIGMVRVVKGMLWAASHLIPRRVRQV